MSILTESKQAEATTNRWRGKVTCRGTCPPWWATESVVGVAEISVGGVFTCLVHVARGRNGAWFANMPSAKRGDQWIPQFTVDDPALEKEVARVAKAAVQAAEVTGSAATAAAAEGDDDDLFA